MSIREPALGTSTVNIFVSYAHEDHSWCNVFRKHVSYISRDHKVNLFSDADIPPGTDWKELILSKIRAADIFIVLLTKNFAASDFCNDVELALATINESAQVIPIVLEHM